MDSSLPNECKWHLSGQGYMFVQVTNPTIKFVGIYGFSNNDM
jgi:hypothetical protein